MDDIDEAIRILNEALQAWNQVEAHIGKQARELPRTQKNALVAGYFMLATQLNESAILSVGSGRLAAARVLIRPVLEAYGRGLYIAYACDDEWCSNALNTLKSANSAHEAGAVDEFVRLDRSVRIPSGFRLAEEIEKIADVESRDSYATLYATLKPYLDTDTHCGIPQALRVLNSTIADSPKFTLEHARLSLGVLDMQVQVFVALCRARGRADLAVEAKAIGRTILGHANRDLSERFPEAV